MSLVNQKYENSLRTFDPQFRRMARYYDLYRGYYQGRYHPFRNNLHIPLLFSMIQSDVARKTGMLFGEKPYVGFTGGGPEDQKYARKQQALVNKQFDDSGTYLKGVDLLTAGDIYGTVVYRYFWRHEEGMTKVRFDSGHGEQTATAPTTKFNGPDWEMIDIIDFFPEPGYRRIEDMSGVVFRYWMELEDVKIHAENGYFERPGVKELSFSPPGPDVEAAFAWRRNVATGGLVEDNRKQLNQFDNFRRPVEILEYHGRVPRGLVNDDEPLRVITVANRMHMLRNIPEPIPGGKIPFGAYSPQPDPHYFHSPGKIETNAKLQYALNRLANQKMDALDLFVDPAFIASRRSGFDARNMRMRPGKVFWTDNSATDDAIRPLQPPIQQLATVYAEMDQLNRYMQQGTGIIDDTVQGQKTGSSRVTAREFQGRQESASTRILMEVRNAEKQWLEPLARAYVGMNREFLPFPQEVRMIGANALVDPVSGQPTGEEGESMQISVNDMLPDYDIESIGATRQLGIGARQQNLMMLMQVGMQNPVAAASINWPMFLRMLFQAFEIKNVDELLQTDEMIQQAMALWLEQNGAGGTSGGETGGEGSNIASPNTQEPGDQSGGLATVLQGLMGQPGLGGQNVQ